MSPYVEAPPPWTLKGTVYSFLFLVSSPTAKDLPSICFSPLEAASVFASGTPKGGLGMVQVIRYTESPVGPYDELLVVPGAFEYEIGDKDKRGGVIKKRNVRVSRIYVNVKETCWNGRKSKLIGFLSILPLGFSLCALIGTASEAHILTIPRLEYPEAPCPL